MGKDKRGIERGHCIECECDEYESSAVRCDYCGHTPMSHVPFDPKRPRYDATPGATPTREVSVETNTVSFSVVKEDGPQPVKERLDEGLAREGPEQLTNANDTPAAHQPERASHGEEFAEKGADASGAEPTKEASVIEVDTSVDDEVVRFQRKINAVRKTRRFVISKNNGKLFAFCNVCSVKMVAGKEHKGQDMFLITQHMATATHKTNKATCLSRESEIPAAILEVQRQVEDKYPRVFSFTTASILCRACKVEFSATHKVVLSNIRQHVDSRGHKEKTGKTMAASSKDISSFFTRKIPANKE